ncbi:MAG: family 10 glycosylhydrolase [Cellulosilyticaceae bacterium]
MKKILSMLMSMCLMMTLISIPTQAKAETQQMRAVWISSVYNLDYPSATSKNNPKAQKQEFIKILDELQDMGINTVVMQVRPKGDALYASQINPWSDVLTGRQGMNPGYDPMAFMIEETHKRGMSFHAWLNPYRVTTSGTDLTQLSTDHPARVNPSMVMAHNNALYYNPELPEVKQHIVDTVEEIVKNYDVDGIHFDDYFYPSNYPLPTGESKNGAVANARRGHINEMVRQVGQVIESVKPNVLFGISPGGIWKNTLSDFEGSNTNGSESYYTVYADTKKWIENEWIDYIVPQIYWEMGHSLADYQTLVAWWSDVVKGYDVALYIGHGIYKDAVAREIDKQLELAKSYDQVEGSFYFSLKDLRNNRQDCRNKIKSFNNNNPVEDVVIPEIKPVQPPTQVIGKKGKVTAETLNVRSGARADRPIITKVTRDTIVSILDQMPGWYKVRLVDNQVGWVSSEYVTVVPVVQEPSKTGKVSVNTLNVRSGPDTAYPVVAKLGKDAQVTILAEQGKWYKLQLTDGIQGWASKEYIR